MASLSEKATTDSIETLLEAAERCYADLFGLHKTLNFPGLDESRRAALERTCQIRFWDMMSRLYSILDQSYFCLYCNFQNDGNYSFSTAAKEIKQPLKENLKWSEDDTRDGQPECKERRNGWVTEQCKKIFGRDCPKHIRSFQDNILQLQAIIKVDQRGKEVPGPNGGPTLVRACNIQHDAAGNSLQFSPSNVSFKELKTVPNIDDWDDATVFNLLHYFRNRNLHRLLNRIKCDIWDGYFNSETGEFRPPGQQLPEPWIKGWKVFWILVPELSHLRQTRDERLHVEPNCYYPHQLLKFCAKALNFVKIQKSTLLHFVGCECQDDVHGIPQDLSNQ